MSTERTYPAPGTSPQTPQSSEGSSTLGPSIRINGRIEASEELVIKGTVQGDLNVAHRVVLTEKGRIEGTLSGRELEVFGRFEGEARATQKLTIHASGKLEGNIQTPRLVIREGAYFTGNASMEDSRRP